MRTERTNNINLQGNLVIKNHLSTKPTYNLGKVRKDIENLILKKDYNLYVMQDYIRDAIFITADYPFPRKPSQTPLLLEKAEEKLPIDAKASRYIDTARKTIEKHEELLKKEYDRQWKNEQKAKKVNALQEIAELIIFSPLFILGDILHSINPKWSSKYEKLIDKLI